MSNKNKSLEPEIKHPLKNFYRIACVVSESDAGSHEAAVGYLQEIDSSTFIAAGKEILNSDRYHLLLLGQLLDLCEEYYELCDKHHVKYDDETKNKLLEDIELCILRNRQKKNPSMPHLLQILHAVHKSRDAEISEELRSDLEKITHETFLDAIAEVMDCKVNRLQSLEMILLYATEYYQLCGEMDIKYSNHAKDSLIAYVKSNIQKVEKMEAKAYE